MPSTLYESVKNSVLQFAQIKKRNERKQDKMIFKWKLITLVLAILLIVLIGAFSQLLQTINNIPDITSDKTYIMPLLKQVNEQSVQTLNQANNLIKSITVASDNDEVYFEWNEATQLISSKGSLDVPTLLATINGYQQLLFVFSYVYNTTYTARFGLRAHKGYNENTKNGNTIIVQDDSQTRYSSIFNINTGQSFRYDVNGCHLFARDATSLTIFESIVFTENAGNTELSLNVNKSGCFSAATPAQALIEVEKLTGMDITPLTNLSALVVEVYALSLVEQQQFQM